MTARRPYDPAEPLPQGRLVIEASAGTGKTFTIAAAVTRLITEEHIPLDKILVVTFTRAATAELKYRIRDQMVATMRALGGAQAPRDEHMQVLVDAGRDIREGYGSRLLTALSGFDGAQIFTIHSFAQRLLRHIGFRSRLAPDLEAGEIDPLLLAETASDLVVGRFIDDPDGVIKVDTVASIGALVTATPDALLVPIPGAVEGEPKIRAELAVAMKDELRRRLNAMGSITFDDGLAEARAALCDPHIGASAKQLLRQRYRVALVDESQDTDPMQWNVIRALFDDSRLMIIGDPKQSIYAFRGADVQSYLAAAAGADASRTLGTNWRSDGPLIAALDTLLAGVTFGDGILYHTVEPAPDNVAARIAGAGAPLIIHRFGPEIPVARKRNREFRINDAREMVAEDVAAHVVKLLGGGATVTRDDETRAIGPGDIAVLCRTRSQVEMIQRALTSREVPSVAARSGSVFDTPAAESWRRFLLAIERPERTAAVRLAATTLLVGKELAEVARLEDEEVLDLQNQIRQWRTTLHDRGVPALLADVDRASDVAGRVLARPDGERTMTDLMHIAEEMHSVWRRRRIGSLALWLETQMDQARENADRGVEEPESRQRRLETDAAAVQVQTVHAAKGLEFPVVFVPYLWDVPSAPPGAEDVPVFHEQTPPAAGEPRRRVIDVGGKDSPEFAEHKALAAEEGTAEEARLLYVALTRAKHRLEVWWVEEAAGSDRTKLHELLAGRGGVEALVRESGGTIDQVILNEQPPQEAYVPPAEPARELQLARLQRPLDYLWRRVSFSSLSPEHPIGGAVETTEAPLRSDEVAEDDAAVAGEPVAGSELPMADLPRGAAFGSLVHHVLEVVPLDSPDLTAAFVAAIEDEMTGHSWDFDPLLLAAGLTLAVGTPLGVFADAPTLHDLNPEQALKEMTFELPVRTSAGAVSLRDVARIMLDELPAHDPYLGYAEELAELPAVPFRGYLTGAIDFITVLPDPGGDRFVVMDYKSNALPMRGRAPAAVDYGHGPLVAAMREGNYVLQSLLYQVALHRYLQWRLAGYEPATHLGGSTYLFVRGMVGPDTPVVGGARCGVAQWMPPPDMIVAVSRLFAGKST